MVVVELDAEDDCGRSLLQAVATDLAPHAHEENPRLLPLRRDAIRAGTTGDPRAAPTPSPRGLDTLRRSGIGVGGQDMARRSRSKVDRRGFLKGAGAAGAAALKVPVASAARAPPDRGTSGDSALAEQASQRLAAETAPLGEEANPLVVADPGSDFMVDVLKSLDFECIISNPGSSFRGLHESFINHGGNKSPVVDVHARTGGGEHRQRLLRGGGKPMAMITFAPSGLQHAVMGIFGAFSGRTPTYLLCANILDGQARRLASTGDCSDAGPRECPRHAEGDEGRAAGALPSRRCAPRSGNESGAGR